MKKYHILFLVVTVMFILPKESFSGSRLYSDDVTKFSKELKSQSDELGALLMYYSLDGIKADESMYTSFGMQIMRSSQAILRYEAELLLVYQLIKDEYKEVVVKTRVTSLKKTKKILEENMSHLKFLKKNHSKKELKQGVNKAYYEIEASIRRIEKIIKLAERQS